MLSFSAISQKKVLNMDDKPTRYTVLGVGVVTWLFALLIIYQIFQHVTVDQNLLNLVIGWMQAIVLGGATFFFGHRVGKNGNGAPPTTNGAP